MTGDTHYDLEILAELAEGLLDDATARQVREHLAICDPCGESLADLAAVREVLAAMPVPAMPLGVAMRIDRALAAETTRSLGEHDPEGRRDGGLRVAEAPDWDRIMQDSPWETAPDPAPDLAPVSLGVVADDGTIVTPVRRKKGSRRRLWAMPVAAAAAAAVVIGGAGLATSLISAGGPQSPSVVGAGGPSIAPSKTELKGRVSYSVYASGHNYTTRELSGPLLGYFGVAPGSWTNDDQDLDKCVKRFSSQLDRKPIGVDKALYNGNEATIMAFWEDKTINAVRVVVVDSDCKSLRSQGLATWR
ncbi:anti-sigma factor [Planotetraspora sp. GP83]|uniref:anti-sigma factor family protein n=1 Tax=Planotetraspora sp. GP83 TaxID=3156264 RepID=UPI003516BA2F